LDSSPSPAVRADALIERGKNLLISVSGIRGIIPAGLDPLNVVCFARALAAVTGKRIVVGQDARPTGPALKHILIGTLQAAGKTVIDIGLAPTPTVKAAVALHGDAGVMISASHNPLEWNGFKLIQKGGYFFDAPMNERWMRALRDNVDPTVDYKRFGQVTQIDAVADHIEAVLKALPLRKEIRAQKYRVAVDAVAGAGRAALPQLLEELGCKVERLYCDASDRFPRPPEPTPTALKSFGRLVKDTKAAVGFALDPDADRLVCGSQAQGAINEEYTLPLAFLGLAPFLKKTAKSRGPIVVNLSTSTLCDTIAAKYGVPVVRAAVGEANVVELMRKRGAIFGGEGNGGVIHPGIPSYGRDSLIGAALVLQAMAHRKAKSVDLLMRDLAVLHMQKTKFEFERSQLAAIFARFEQGFGPGVQVDRRDGLYLSFPDGAWLHVRASNTEPILRVIAQASGPRELRDLIKNGRSFLV
jgi:phosphomannomutase